MKRYDIAIIGSGFAGSILARVLRRQGRRVVLLEKGRHPRFALGESTTPLANFALERLARRSGLRDLFDLAAYGRWQERLPHLRRGLKRGFTFYGHRRGRPFRNDINNSHRLLVAASPEDALADSHWLRADVDHHLVERAEAEGVDVHQQTTVTAVERLDDGWRLHTSRSGRPTVFAARYVVDGSGPAAVVPRSLGMRPVDAETLPQASLLFTHTHCPPPFRPPVGAPDGRRDGPHPDGPHPDGPHPDGPYPDDHAAVHHLLEEGWIYLLPFDPDAAAQASPRLASLGAVLYGPPGGDARHTEPAEAAWRRLLASYPALETQLADLPTVRPWRRLEPLAYRQRRAAGNGWFLLPHTFAFYDPMFSTGMAWSLLAVERLCDLLGAESASRPVDPLPYADLLANEADQIAHLITAARSARHHFELFKHVAFLYFAVVSHTELRQRLLDPPPQRPHAWEGFLGASEPHWRQVFAQAAARSTDHDSAETVRWLRQVVQPWDAIGLDVPNRANLYPVDLQILRQRAHVLGMEARQMDAALPRLRGEPW